MDLVVEFFKHNTMMNERVLESCRRLSPEQLEASAEGTFGSVAATLVHVANSQHGYAARFLGVDRPEPLSADPFAGLDAVAERMASGNALLEEAAAQAEREFAVTVRGDDPVGTWRMPGTLLLLQAINHGTEHRSQISTILTQLGIEPPSMDGWTYFFDAGHMVDVEDASP